MKSRVTSNFNANRNLSRIHPEGSSSIDSCSMGANLPRKRSTSTWQIQKTDWTLYKCSVNASDPTKGKKLKHLLSSYCYKSLTRGQRNSTEQSGKLSNAKSGVLMGNMLCQLCNSFRSCKMAKNNSLMIAQHYGLQSTCR